MIVVIASAADAAAASLVRHRLRNCRLLTPPDLSTPHWICEWSRPSAHRAYANGNRFRSSEVRGVLSLLPAVTPGELPHIASDDREYVAAEMHAFLYFWLQELRCPVLNRPRDGALNGPPWSLARWQWHALQEGLQIHRGGPAHHTESAAVVGDLVFAPGLPLDVQDGVRRLARRADVSLLTAVFANGAFVGAHPMPVLADERVADAVAQLLMVGPA
jgi:hypothetical protein